MDADVKRYLDPADYEKTYTPAEYLALERNLETKNEYYRGRMRDVSGANEPHNCIVSSTLGELWEQLRERPLIVLISRMRIKVQATGLYTYPDLLVTHQDLPSEDDEDDTLLEPIVIAEVVSAKTEAYDRGDKFWHYRRIPSLKEFLLIAERKRLVEHYVRESANAWRYSEYSRLSDVVDLPSVGCRVAIRAIYEKVEFGDE
jgi:Uma2 family endonuclease